LNLTLIAYQTRASFYKGKFPAEPIRGGIFITRGEITQSILKITPGPVTIVLNWTHLKRDRVGSILLGWAKSSTQMSLTKTSSAPLLRPPEFNFVVFRGFSHVVSPQ